VALHPGGGRDSLFLKGITTEVDSIPDHSLEEPNPNFSIFRNSASRKLSQGTSCDQISIYKCNSLSGFAVCDSRKINPITLIFL